MMRVLAIYGLVVGVMIYLVACGDTSVLTNDGGNPEPVPGKIRFLNKTSQPARIKVAGVTREGTADDGKKNWKEDKSPTKEREADYYSDVKGKERPDEPGDIIDHDGRAALDHPTWRNVDLIPIDPKKFPKAKTHHVFLTVYVGPSDNETAIPIQLRVKSSKKNKGEDFFGDLILLLTESVEGETTYYTAELYSEFAYNAKKGYARAHKKMKKKD